MAMKVARSMVPAVPPEDLCCSCAWRRTYFSLEQSYLFVMVCKTLKLVPFAKFVPLEGLCYLCFHVLFSLYAFWSHLFALWSCRYGMPEQ